MDAATRRALHLVRAALEIDPAQRTDWLAAECRDDDGLRERAASLLQDAAALEDGDNDQDRPPPPADDGTDNVSGSLLGPFRVQERIGRGGMGVVYRALREGDGLAQQVAIKLLRRGHETSGLQARFLRERRILARLSHPHLARFIDAGVAPDGRPWFALDFVPGEAITTWCDRQRLDLRARASLFLQVCAALRYAHGQLVVHHDLKPGNILVDAQGQARLLDFGIARLLDGSDSDAGARRALTAQYAAPEQFGDEPAGVSADIYALGMVLYELVAGSLPYRVPPHDALAARRLALEAPYVPADIALTRDASPALAAERLAARSTTLAKLRRAARGDLGRLLAKALEKAPENRYASVQEFAADLQHWLQDRPVQAAHAGTWRRLGLFLRRNRLPVAFGLLAAAALLAGIAGIQLQARRAQQESRRLDAIQAYLTSLFESNVPGAPADQLPDTRELLARGVQRARGELAGQPLLQADLLALLGRIHAQLGLRDEAEPLLRDALQLREQLGGSNDPRLAEILFEQARLERQRNRYAQSEALLRRGLALAARDDLQTQARLRNLLGVVLALQGQVGAGEAELQQALQLWRRGDQAGSALEASTLNDIAFVLDGDDRGAEALPYYQQALALQLRLHGPVHASIAVTHNNLAETLRKLGRLDEAEPHYRQAVAIDAQVYTAPAVAWSRHIANFALLHMQRGDSDAAETLLREALRMREALYPPGDAQIAATLTNLAAAQVDQDKSTEAEATARRALAIYASSSGDWRRSTAFAQQNLARALRGQQRWPEAETAAREALRLHLALRGESAPDVLNARAALGRVLLESGRIAEAQSLLLATANDSARVLPPRHPQRLDRQYDAAQAQAAAGQLTDARQRYETLLQDLAAAGSAAKPTLRRNARLGLAGVLEQQGHADEAKQQRELAGAEWRVERSEK